MKFKILLGLIVLILVLFGTSKIIKLSNQTLFQSSLKPSASPSSSILNSPPSNFNLSQGATPNIPFNLASGFTIHIFASGLGNPRDLQFSPGGTLLVSNPSSNTVYALPDKNNDGVADSKKVVISGRNHTHGLAFFNGKLYASEVDRVVRYDWDEQKLTATFDKVLFSLPENNDHNNRTITFDSSGKMFVSVGSTCNVCFESSPLSATVLVADPDYNNPQIFAKGLRNAAFLAINPKTSELWGTEMGRDNLGDNIPPDEINIIRSNLDYGWPFCFADKQHDVNFDPRNQHSCGNTQPPIYQIPAHSAPLGLTFINSSQFPTDWQGDLLVSYHGSWNRSTPIGYKVVHLKVSENSITNSEDFLTGFLPAGATNGPNSALARPVDLTFDQKGSLYLSDDKSGNIFIIQKSN